MAKDTNGKNGKKAPITKEEADKALAFNFPEEIDHFKDITLKTDLPKHDTHHKKAWELCNLYLRHKEDFSKLPNPEKVLEEAREITNNSVLQINIAEIVSKGFKTLMHIQAGMLLNLQKGIVESQEGNWKKWFEEKYKTKQSRQISYYMSIATVPGIEKYAALTMERLKDIKKVIEKKKSIEDPVGEWLSKHGIEYVPSNDEKAIVDKIKEIDIALDLELLKKEELEEITKEQVEKLHKAEIDVKKYILDLQAAKTAGKNISEVTDKLIEKGKINIAEQDRGSLFNEAISNLLKEYKDASDSVSVLKKIDEDRFEDLKAMVEKLDKNRELLKLDK